MVKSRKYIVKFTFERKLIQCFLTVLSNSPISSYIRDYSNIRTELPIFTWTSYKTGKLFQLFIDYYELTKMTSNNIVDMYVCILCFIQTSMLV